MSDKPRVTGIGGIFFKSQNPNELKEWYAQNLGLNTDQWGAMFQWLEVDNPHKKGATQWSPFDQKTEYFNPSQKEFMINYRVTHIEELVAQLKENGVEVLDEIASYDYGKFVHILDNEGNKIELWEAIDEE